MTDVGDREADLLGKQKIPPEKMTADPLSKEETILESEETRERKTTNLRR